VFSVSAEQCGVTTNGPWVIPNTSNNLPLILGVTIGVGGALVIAVAVTVFVMYSRKHKQDKKSQPPSEPYSYAINTNSADTDRNYDQLSTPNGPYEYVDTTSGCFVRPPAEAYSSLNRRSDDLPYTPLALPHNYVNMHQSTTSNAHLSGNRKDEYVVPDA